MSGLLGLNKTINQTENQLSTLKIQTATQGVPIPIVYGSTRVSGNNIWYGNFTPVPHTSSQTSGGGKGGGITTVTTTWTYTCTLAMGICEGPSGGAGIFGIGRIWSNKEVADDLQLGFTIFKGTYPQAAWSYFSTYYPQQALSYAGLCYVANSAFDLGNSNYLPNLSFELNGLLYTGTGPSVTYATFDPGQKNPRVQLSNGNLTASLAAGSVNAGWAMVKGNVYKSTGKWKAEFTVQTPVQMHMICGICGTAAPVTDNAHLGIDTNGAGYYGTVTPTGTGWFSGNGNFSDQGGMPLLNSGDVVGILYDGDAQSFIVKVNGLQVGATMATTYGSSTSHTFAASLWCASGTTSVTVNTGATAFAYSDPGYSGFSGVSAQFDVTPAAVLNDLLPNVTYGALFPSAQLAPVTDFANYCAAAGLLCSPAYATQQAASNIVTELTSIGNAAPVWSEGLLKFIPYCDATVGSYTPNTTINYDLTDDDFLANPGEDPIKVTRKRQADAYNSVTVECLDRNNSYNIATITIQDQANIDQYGLRQMPPVTLHAICLPSIGSLVAQTILKRQLYFRNLYEFSVGWKYGRLEAMDLVSLTDAGLGLNKTPVRILSITEGEFGDLQIQAEDFISGVANAAVYSNTQSANSGTTIAAQPGNSGTPTIIQPPLSITGTPEIWLGVAPQYIDPSITPNWGGCEVWMSLDGGVSYQKAGQVTAPATLGVLSAPLASNGTDPDVTNTLSVNLSTSRGALASVPQAQADALISLCWVDGELLAYETATLTSQYNYNLTYLRRGQEWTSNGAHSAGTKFLRLDSAICKIDSSGMCADVGTVIYFKLLSYNTSGGDLQSLADVSAIAYTLQPIGMLVTNGNIPNVIPSCQELYIPSNTAYTLSGRMTNHGRIHAAGRLRITA